MGNFDGLLKRRYGRYQNVLPSEDSICQYGRFIPQDQRPGESYQVGIKLTNEHGVAFNSDGTAYDLATAIDAKTKQASINGCNIEMTAIIPRDTIARAANGEGASYFEAIDFKVMSILESAEFYREIQTMYGPGGTTTIASNIGAVNASISGANLAAPQVINITRGTWAPGIWNQYIEGKVDILQSDGVTSRETAVTVQAVTAAKCRLKLYKAGSVATVAAGDLIVPAGSVGTACTGLQPILENTGSLFGIDAAVYPSWQGVTFSAGSAGMTRAKVLGMASRIYPNGLRTGGTLFVSGATFADLAEEADALQRFNGNTDDVKRQGANALEYKSPIGLIRVQVHGYKKQGIAFFIGNEVFERVGSTEITTQMKGTNRFFYTELPTKSGSQIGCFTNQAPFLRVPYHCAIVTAIVNNQDATPS